MKSVIILPQTFSKIGGIQRFNRKVLDSLNDLGIASTVLAVNDEVSDRDLLKYKKVYTVNKKSPLSLIRFYAKTLFSTDLILLGHVNYLPLLVLYKLFNPSSNAVLFVHGVDVWNDPIFRKKRFYDSMLLKLVDTVASVSQYTAEIMSREYQVPKSKFTIFPNVIDGPIFTKSQYSKESYFLSVTRMASHDKSKNIELVLRSFSQVLKDHPSVRLKIVGTGIFLDSYRLLASELGIASNVDFLGRVDDDELLSLYKSAKAFVLPSDKEGFGIVYLEAWKYSLPVICSSKGASSEIVEHMKSGLVCNTDSPNELTEQMQLLLNDNDLALKLGAAGAEKLRNFYLQPNMVQNLKGLIYS